MALQLSTTLNTGCSGNYWRIYEVRVDRNRQTITMQVYLYLTQAARETGLMPLSAATYVLSGTDYTTVMASTNFIQALYDYLKAQPQFSGEVDV